MAYLPGYQNPVPATVLITRMWLSFRQITRPQYLGTGRSLIDRAEGKLTIEEIVVMGRMPHKKTLRGLQRPDFVIADNYMALFGLVENEK